MGLNRDVLLQVGLFFVVLGASYFYWIAFVPYAIFTASYLITRWHEVKYAEVSKDKEKSFEYKLIELESRLGRVEMDQV